MTSSDFAICHGTPQDLPAIVVIHQSAFPGFLMTQLGSKFLRDYYQAVLDCPDGILLVAMDSDGEVIGFVSGATHPAVFYESLRERRVRLALSGCIHLLVHPELWWRVLQNARDVSSKGRAGSTEGGELASLAVNPAASGKGCGASLVLKFIELARAGGAHRVYLTTDAVENDRVNRFYKGLGFQCTAQERRAATRWMNRYEIEF